MARMTALVYEAPHQMPLREVDVPALRPNEVLIRVAYSGICGSELSGFEGKNTLRKPPLIMGHEFSGQIEQIGQEAAARFPAFQVGQAVTVNPLITCGECLYCLRGQHQLCANRMLLSASLPGSNAQYVAARADAVLPLPPGMSLTVAALTEPTACAVHIAALVVPKPHESALVVGAGPIGLLTIQALQNCGVKHVYCADLNAERLARATTLGANAVKLDEAHGQVDIAVDAVGATATRQGCMAAVRSGGRVVWTGLHEAESQLPVNDMIRREITTYGSFAYTRLDFANALQALAEGRLRLDPGWTRIEPLANGAACFIELLRGSPTVKIWLDPWQ
jgi:2-desacetyl-2-hydroxyethyl bacteriochlorophyllide A dehydrogenase